MADAGKTKNNEIVKMFKYVKRISHHRNFSVIFKKIDKGVI